METTDEPHRRSSTTNTCFAGRQEGQPWLRPCPSAVGNPFRGEHLQADLDLCAGRDTYFGQLRRNTTFLSEIRYGF